MSSIAYWIFGAWVSAFVGVTFAIIGFDVWLNHRRDVMRNGDGS